METTAAGMEADTVIPTRSPRYAFAARGNEAPALREVRVNEARHRNVIAAPVLAEPREKPAEMLLNPTGSGLPAALSQAMLPAEDILRKNQMNVELVQSIDDVASQKDRKSVV